MLQGVNVMDDSFAGQTLIPVQASLQDAATEFIHRASTVAGRVSAAETGARMSLWVFLPQHASWSPPGQALI